MRPPDPAPARVAPERGTLPGVAASVSGAQRIRHAFDLYEAGVSMRRAALRREHPDADEARIAGLLREWLHTRPGAEFGDAVGRPRPPAPVSGLEETARRVVGLPALRRFHVAVVGELAVSVRTEPRFTRGIDLCVAVDDDASAESLIRELRGNGYEVTALVEHEASRRIATVRLGSVADRDAPIVDLLFASSGIEREVAISAEPMELFETVVVPVASVGALIALKLLARDDEHRPQDGIDLARLKAAAGPADLDEARRLVGLIEERGYARGRDLVAALDVLARGPTR